MARLVLPSLWVASAMFLTCVAPSTVRAECGDYVMVRHQTTGGNSNSTPRERTPQAPVMPCKCQNPACMPQQAPQPTPVEAPGNTTQDLWAARTEQLPAQLSRPFTPNPGVHSVPSHLVDDIFHPPR